MLPAASLRIVEAAEALGLEIVVQEFPAGTKTAADAARAVGCELGQIVKSLVFMADEGPVLSLIPGDLRLDEEKLAAATGATTVRRASLDEARDATGFVAGGTPPFGHAVPVLAARTLGRHSDLFAAAGTPTTVFSVGLEDLMRTTGARWADLTLPRPG